MKKIKKLSLVLAIVMLLSTLLPTVASAASYPLIIDLLTESDHTIEKGTTGILKFSIMCEYKNERYNVEIYNSDNELVGSASDSYYATSYFKDVSIRVNTAELGLDIGKYKVVYWMDFYSYYSWHSAPNKYTTSFEVIKNVCNGNHNLKLDHAITESTCEEEGFGEFVCTRCDHYEYQDLPLAHNFGEWSTYKAPTFTETGIEERFCQTCSARDTNVIDTSRVVKITKQPKSVLVENGKVARTTVTATGDGLTYKWYFRNPSATKYSYTSSYKSNSYSLTMDTSKAGRLVYCVITDKYGNSVRTNTVALNMPATITKQPKTTAVQSGQQAKVTVSAVGKDLTYKWYIKNRGASKFSLSTSFKGNSYYVTMNGERYGRQVYCVITDKYGNSVTTKTVTLGLAVKITKQPTSVTVANGSTAKVSVTASGEGKTYKWYFKDKGSSKFYLSTSITGNTYSTKMTNARAARQIYCVITDKYGNSEKTNVVTLNKK